MHIIFKNIIALCVLTAMLFSTITVIGVDTMTTNVVIVSGYANSGESGKMVTIVVYPQGKTAEDWENAQNALDAVTYYNQTSTVNSGYYEFLVNLDFTNSQVYTAYVKIEDETGTRVKTLSKKYEFNCNFEDYTGGKPVGWNEIVTPDTRYTPATVDTEHGTSIKMVPTNASTRLIKLFDGMSIGSGVSLLSFDFRASSTSNLTYIRLLTDQYTAFNTANDPYMLESFYANADGEMGYYSDTSGWNKIKAINYVNDYWYNVKMWIDLDLHKVYYYINNVYYGWTYISPVNLAGIAITSSNNTANSVYLDNVLFKDLDYCDVISMVNHGINVPEHLRDDVVLSVGSSEIGNIFFGNNDISLNLNAKNRSYNSKDLNCSITVRNEDNQIVWSANEVFTSSSEETVQRIITPPISQYGVYTVDIVDQNYGYSTTSEFSLCVASVTKNEKVGTCVHFDRPRGDVDKCMPLIESAGFGITRCDWNWNENPINVYYDYNAKFNSYIQESVRSGTEMLAILDLTNSNYVDSDGQLCTTPEGLLALENYAEWFARQYTGTVKYIEIGNEWNHIDTHVPCADYVEVLKAAYNGIKRGNPNAKVVGFSTSTIPLSYLEEALSLGAAPYFDAISVHPYHITTAPEKIETWRGNSWIQYAQSLKDFAVQHNLQDKELWASELGWYTSGGAYPQIENNQAAYYVRNIALNEAYDFFDRLIFYDFQNDGYDLTYDEDNFGIVDSYKEVNVPYSAKPAYLATANYNNLLGDADFVSVNTTNTNNTTAYNCKFSRNSDGAEVYMLWSLDNGGQVTLNLESGTYLSVYDMYGNKTDVTLTSDNYTITTGIEPIYVEIPNCMVGLAKAGENLSSITQLNGNDVINVFAKINFNDNIGTNYMLAAAQYRGNTLVDYKSDFFKAGETTNNFDLVYSENVNKIKVFFWGGYTTINPIAKCYTLI